MHVAAKAVERASTDVRSPGGQFRNSNMGGANAKTIALSTTPTYPGQVWFMKDQKNFIYREVKEHPPPDHHLDEAMASMLFRNYVDLSVRNKDGDNSNNTRRVLAPYNPAEQIATVPIFFALSREASAAAEAVLGSEMGLIDTDSPYPDDTGFVDYYFGHTPGLKSSRPGVGPPGPGSSVEIQSSRALLFCFPRTSYERPCEDRSVARAV